VCVAVSSGFGVVPGFLSGKKNDSVRILNEYAARVRSRFPRVFELSRGF